MIAHTPLTQAVASAASCAHLVRRLLAQGAMPAPSFSLSFEKLWTGLVIIAYGLHELFLVDTRFIGRTHNINFQS